jgi:hypothetical protein
VIDLERDSATVEGSAQDAGRQVRIEFAERVPGGPRGRRRDGRGAGSDRGAGRRFWCAIGGRGIAPRGPCRSAYDPGRGGGAARAWLGVHLSLSHELGTLGLIERENSTILNAALATTARGVAALLHHALRAERIDPEPFVTRNDGAFDGTRLRPAFPGADARQRTGERHARGRHLTGMDEAANSRRGRRR